MPAELPGGCRGHLARVHRIEVPPRRQHVRAPARGRAGGAGCDEAAVQRTQQAGGLGLRTGVQRRRDGLRHLAQHGGARVPRGGQTAGAGDQARRQALQALDRVAVRSPWRAVGERGGPWPPPGRAERGRERVHVQREIVGQRTQQRGPVLTGAAHAPRDGTEKLVAACGFGRLPKNVEAVADLHLLDLAEITVELAERVVVAVGGRDAAILVEPDGGGKLQDARAQRRTAARIERGGVEELVHQPLQLFQRAMAAGARQRRRQMIDDHRGAPPLGLAALAGIVHDEGIDVRDRPERGFRKTLGRERQRLAGQPFHIAVLAHMHKRMGIEGRAQPRIEGEVAVRRRQGGIVVARLRVDVVAPRRLDRGHDIAEAQRRQREAPRVTAEEGIGRRLPPAPGDGVPHGRGQQREETLVVGERERCLGRAGAGIGGGR